MPFLSNWPSSSQLEDYKRGLGPREQEQLGKREAGVRAFVKLALSLGHGGCSDGSTHL